MIYYNWFLKLSCIWDLHGSWNIILIKHLILNAPGVVIFWTFKLKNMGYKSQLLQLGKMPIYKKQEQVKVFMIIWVINVYFLNCGKKYMFLLYTCMFTHLQYSHSLTLMPKNLINTSSQSSAWLSSFSCLLSDVSWLVMTLSTHFTVNLEHFFNNSNFSNKAICISFYQAAYFTRIILFLHLNNSRVSHKILWNLN